jgi:nicotinamide riboside kinase
MNSHAEPIGVLSIVGGESTGKSTLAEALADRLPGLLVPETLRLWVQEHGRVPTVGEQRQVFDAHISAEELAQTEAAEQGVRWVVSDSGPLMTAVYSVQYYNSFDLVEPAMLHVGHSTLVVWCDDDFPWQPDNQRDGASARSTAQSVLREFFSQHPQVPVLRVSGSPADRLHSVIDEISS